MNLWSLLSGVLDLHFGGSSNRGKNVPNDDSYTNVSGALDNMLNKISGARLTDAEREANAFTAQREDLAWQRQMDASNTAYQRQVADMQKAGLNPMLALGAGGASSPSASSSGSVSPAGGSFNLGTLLSLIMLPSQLKNMKAERKLTEAQAGLAESQAGLAEANADKVVSERSNVEEMTRGSRLQNDYFEQVSEIRKRGESLANDLTHAQYKELYKKMDVYSAQITKDIETAHSEQQKQNLYIQQALLAGSERENIVKMRPFLQEYYKAQSDLDRKLAAVAVLDEAYRNELLTRDVIGKSIEAANAKISVDEAEAELKRIQGLIAKGDKKSLMAELGSLDKIDFMFNYTLDALGKVADSVPVVFVK